MDFEHGNGDNGITTQKVTVLQVLFNHDTGLVSLGIKDVPIELAQMIVFAAAEQLSIMRRQAAALNLKANMEQQNQLAGVVEEIRRKARGG